MNKAKAIICSHCKKRVHKRFGLRTKSLWKWDCLANFVIFFNLYVSLIQNAVVTDKNALNIIASAWIKTTTLYTILIINILVMILLAWRLALAFILGKLYTFKKGENTSEK